ncbi:hypothetical protein MAR_015991 [Mya arenaria]|uniref:Uncharacterized protein n=1 Tax=Mya arenaria TaxID=6604 RepID=A0ABY7FLU6_MYAAR|nr:hypothetical protein MAR_015991 [Mya arenaria]
MVKFLDYLDMTLRTDLENEIGQKLKFDPQPQLQRMQDDWRSSRQIMSFSRAVIAFNAHAQKILHSDRWRESSIAYLTPKEVYVPHLMFARVRDLTQKCKQCWMQTDDRKAYTNLEAVIKACSKNPMKRGAAMALKLADIKPISLPSPDMEIFLQTADP